MSVSVMVLSYWEIEDHGQFYKKITVVTYGRKMFYNIGPRLRELSREKHS